MSDHDRWPAVAALPPDERRAYRHALRCAERAHQQATRGCDGTLCLHATDADLLRCARTLRALSLAGSPWRPGALAAGCEVVRAAFEAAAAWDAPDEAVLLASELGVTIDEAVTVWARLGTPGP